MANRRRETRMDKMTWAIQEFLRRNGSGRPMEFRLIVNFFARKSEQKFIRRALDIDFVVRPEFMLMSIERPGTGIETRFDGDTKLVTLAKWGWGKKPLLATEVREVEESRPRARGLPIKGYKIHVG